jgi:hypothetical protein
MAVTLTARPRFFTETVCDAGCAYSGVVAFGAARALGGADGKRPYLLHHRVPMGPGAATWPVCLRHQASF